MVTADSAICEPADGQLQGHGRLYMPQDEGRAHAVETRHGLLGVTSKTTAQKVQIPCEGQYTVQYRSSTESVPPGWMMVYFKPLAMRYCSALRFHCRMWPPAMLFSGLAGLVPPCGTTCTCDGGTWRFIHCCMPGTILNRVDCFNFQHTGVGREARGR